MPFDFRPHPPPRGGWRAPGPTDRAVRAGATRRRGNRSTTSSGPWSISTAALDNPAGSDEFTGARYLYFNAGFFPTTCDPRPSPSGQRFTDYALAIRDDAPAELVCQSLDPWLDQVALPLVIQCAWAAGATALPEGMAGWLAFLPLPLTCEETYGLSLARVAAGLCAGGSARDRRAGTGHRPNKIKKVLKAYDPIKRMIYQGNGRKARALFDAAPGQPAAQGNRAIRNTLKREKLWLPLRALNGKRPPPGWGEAVKIGWVSGCAGQPALAGSSFCAPIDHSGCASEVHGLLVHPRPLPRLRCWAGRTWCRAGCLP